MNANAAATHIGGHTTGGAVVFGSPARGAQNGSQLCLKYNLVRGGMGRGRGTGSGQDGGGRGREERRNEET